MTRRYSVDFRPPTTPKDFARTCVELDDVLRDVAVRLTAWRRGIELPETVASALQVAIDGLHKAADGGESAALAVLAPAPEPDSPPAVPKASTGERGPSVPDAIARPILALLAERGPDGARRSELVTAVGKSRSRVAITLAALRDHGAIVAQGAGKAARYYLPQHAPDPPPTGHGP